MQTRKLVGKLLVIGLVLVVVSLLITLARFNPSIASSDGLSLVLCIIQVLIIACYGTILKLKIDLGEENIMDWVIPGIWVICLVLNFSSLLLRQAA